MLEYTVRGVERLVKTADGFSVQFPRQLRDALDYGAGFVQNAAKSTTSFRDRTSNLRNSIHRIPAQVENGNAVAKVRAGMEYAIYIERGTGIYGPRRQPIRPKRRPYLVFRTPDGQWVRTKQVKGIRPRRFMEQALKAHVPDIERVVGAAVKAALRGGA